MSDLDCRAELERRAENWRIEQVTLDQRGLEARAPDVAHDINALCPPAVKDFPVSARAEKFGTDAAENGIALLGNLLTASQCDELTDYFASRDCFNAHIHSRSDKVPRRFADIAADSPVATYRLADIVRAPHLLEIVNQPDLLGAAKRFLGCTPTIYSLNAWWSFPGDEDRDVGTESFHRDVDDYRFLSLFIYLTDVDGGAGPHQYMRKTHTVAGLEECLLLSMGPLDAAQRDEIKKSKAFEAVMALLVPGESHLPEQKIRDLLGSDIVTVEGAKGTAFLAAPAGFHRGLPPADKPRLMFWARYGMFRNFVSVADGIAPVALEDFGRRLSDDAVSHYVNRLIVDPDRPI